MNHRSAGLLVKLALQCALLSLPAIALSSVPEEKHGSSSSLLVPGAATPHALPGNMLPTDIPVKRDVPAAESGASRTGIALAALIAVLVSLAVGISWLRRHGTQPAGAKPWNRWTGLRCDTAITVVASTRLGAHGSLHVVQWEGGKILVGCSAQAITVLGTAPESTGTEIIAS